MSTDLSNFPAEQRHMHAQLQASNGDGRNPLQPALGIIQQAPQGASTADLADIVWMAANLQNLNSGNAGYFVQQGPLADHSSPAPSAPTAVRPMMAFASLEPLQLPLGASANESPASRLSSPCASMSLSGSPVAASGAFPSLPSYAVSPGVMFPPIASPGALGSPVATKTTQSTVVVKKKAAKIGRL
eukprot:TRINITY_DN83_c6_g1_i1.p1 TRINITY_DN83_c6_g1~~TRINITY_DN83_c6_g1_i1.p1  ORF type:complete len:187 (+),score=15.74 TRINITY_DN83_c6_g1_i1:104-664(+)